VVCVDVDIFLWRFGGKKVVRGLEREYEKPVLAVLLSVHRYKENTVLRGEEEEEEEEEAEDEEEGEEEEGVL